MYTKCHGTPFNKCRDSKNITLNLIKGKSERRLERMNIFCVQILLADISLDK